jgi:hypothetical protein
MLPEEPPERRLRAVLPALQGFGLRTAEAMDNFVGGFHAAELRFLED